MKNPASTRSGSGSIGGSRSESAAAAAQHACSSGRPRQRCVVVRCAKQSSSNPFRDASNGGGRTGRPPGPSANKTPKKPAKPIQPQLTISRPLQITLLEGEEEEEASVHVQPPSWDSFCSALEGEWVGQYGAYTPWEGKPEPVWLDSNKKYIDHAFSRAVEHSWAGQGDGPCLVRKIGRAGSLEEVLQLNIPKEGSSVEDEAVDVEALAFNADGVVVFEGGHYSAGPDYIGPPMFKMLREALDSDSEQEQGREAGAGASGPSPEDEVSEAPGTVSIMEQCLVDRDSRSRFRVKATVTVNHLDNGEVDLSVLRLVLFREVWAGALGAAAPQRPQALLLPSPCTRLPRPSAAQACGRWECTTTSAVSVEPEAAAAGPTPPDQAAEQQQQQPAEAGVAWHYSRSRDVQLWELAGREAPEDGAEGGMFWLPGGVLVTLRMFDVGQEDSDGEGGEMGEGAAAGSPGSDAAPPRGFCMGMTWLTAAGRALQLERYYDEEGCLRDVRCTAAVRAQERQGRAGGVV